MTTRTAARKRAKTADREELRSLVTSQILEIEALKKKLEEATQQKKNADESAATARKEREELKEIIENAHDLMDACPGCLPRNKQVKPYSWSAETTDVPLSLLVRMGSWLGATR